MLTFIGLGLYDKRDISEKGLYLIRNADHVFLEGYTSRLMGATRKTSKSSTKNRSGCSCGLMWSSTRKNCSTAP